MLSFVSFVVIVIIGSIILVIMIWVEILMWVVCVKVELVML